MTIELKVSNMACPKGYRYAYGACGKTITKAVREIDPEASVQTDPTVSYTHLTLPTKRIV